MSGLLICQSTTVYSASIIPFCTISFSQYENGFTTRQQTCTTQGIFFWAEFKHFGFFLHEPSMWPSLSMCISTTEHAFFGLASTWLHLASKLLAITLICFGKCVTCFWKLLMRCTFSLCVLLHLFPVPVWEPIVCWTGVFLPALATGISVYILKLLTGLKAQRIMLKQ